MKIKLNSGRKSQICGTVCHPQRRTKAAKLKTEIIVVKDSFLVDADLTMSKSWPR